MSSIFVCVLFWLETEISAKKTGKKDKTTLMETRDCIPSRQWLKITLEESCLTETFALVEDLKINGIIKKEKKTILW